MKMGSSKHHFFNSLGVVYWQGLIFSVINESFYFRVAIGPEYEKKRLPKTSEKKVILCIFNILSKKPKNLKLTMCWVLQNILSLYYLPQLCEKLLSSML